jgi:hypothetical protein
MVSEANHLSENSPSATRSATFQVPHAPPHREQPIHLALLVLDLVMVSEANHPSENCRSESRTATFHGPLCASSPPAIDSDALNYVLGTCRD